MLCFCGCLPAMLVHWHGPLLAAPSIGKGKGTKGKTCQFRGINIFVTCTAPQSSRLNAELIVWQHIAFRHYLTAKKIHVPMVTCIAMAHIMILFIAVHSNMIFLFWYTHMKIINHLAYNHDQNFKINWHYIGRCRNEWFMKSYCDWYALFTN